MSKGELRMSNDLLQGIREALQELMRVIESKDAQRLNAAMARLTQLQSQLGDDAPPMLKHYLDRRSYEKALAFLEMGKPTASHPLDEAGKPKDKSPRCE